MRSPYGPTVNGECTRRGWRGSSDFGSAMALAAPPSYNSAMANEIEMKFKVASHAAVRRRLDAAGAKYIGGMLQTDCYFDTPRRDLLKRDSGMRIRTAAKLRGHTLAADPRPQLTYKGPVDAKARAKVRPEIQTHLEDAEAFGEILAALGFEPALTIQKKRITYHLGRCLVELDELPILGCFIEIEGPDEAAIERVRAKLQIEDNSTKSGYTKLVTDACAQLGRPCREILFD